MATKKKPAIKKVAAKKPAAKKTAPKKPVAKKAAAKKAAPAKSKVQLKNLKPKSKPAVGPGAGGLSAMSTKGAPTSVVCTA